MPNHLRFFNLLPLCVSTSWRNHCRGLAGSISITGRKDRFDRCAMELKPDSRIRSRRDPGRCICLCQGLWPDKPGIWCSDFTEVALLHRFHVEAIYNGGGRSARSAEEEPNRGLSFVTVSSPLLDAGHNGQKSTSFSRIWRRICNRVVPVSKSGNHHAFYL